MRYIPFAFALMLFGAACSNDEPSASFVSEAQAVQPPAGKDYGWRTTPDFSKKQEDVHEYQ